MHGVKLQNLGRVSRRPRAKIDVATNSVEQTIIFPSEAHLPTQLVLRRPSKINVFSCGWYRTL